MRSSNLLGAFAAVAAVACSAAPPEDPTSFADDSEIADSAAPTSANPAPGDAVAAEPADRDSTGPVNTVRDSGSTRMGDARALSSDGEAGPIVSGDAAGPPVSSDADSTGYNPCPPKGTPCAVMPVGDSITFGVDATLGYNMTNGGYRTRLFDLAHRSGKALTFVGSKSDGPDTVNGTPFPKAHEGHPGWVIIQITDIIVAAMQTYKPKIITLMIGTNDINAGFNPPDAPNRLAKLVDTILATDPQVLVVVAKLVPTQSATENTTVQAYNSAIGALVATRVTAGKHVALVDMYAAFNSGKSTSYLSDNLHPNDAGYTVMAETWFGSIGPLLR
jgi:lysophospholipase L1-like esterase